MYYLVKDWRFILSTNTLKASKLQTAANTGVTKLHLLILAITAIITITIMSASSPIYPFNTWDDANAYFTIGKSIWKDLVPYKDLFDHKGPFLYLIYALATLISSNSFIGIYFIEIISCFVFLFFSYKILRLFLPKAIHLIPFMSLMLFSSTAFERGGGTEEFSLPFFAFALYVLIKGLKEEKLPSPKECLAIGITSGLVFWMKFNLVTFYIGWIIAPVVLSIKKKQLAELFKRICFIIAGVLISTIPFLIYHLITNSVSDLFSIYLYLNIFGYSEPGDGVFVIRLVKALANGFYKMFKYSISSSILLVLGIVFGFLKENKYVVLSQLSMFVCLFLGVYANGRDYEYYPFIFSVFAVFGLVAVIYFVENKLKKDFSKLIKIFLVILALILTFPAPNMYLLAHKKSDLPHYKVKEVIDNSGIENPTLLNYGMLDAGFYTTTGIVPNTKYYYCPNVSYYEIRAEQDKLIRDEKVDFIISIDEIAADSNYELIETYQFFSRTFLLYQHKK